MLKTTTPIGYTSRKNMVVAKYWDTFLAISIGCCIMQACSLNDLVSKGKLPADMIDPAVVQNSFGAIARYHGALNKLASVIGEGGAAATANVRSGAFITTSGIFTDELQVVFPAANPPIFPTDAIHAIDSRSLIGNERNTTLSTTVRATFTKLQDLRIYAREARNALKEYASESPVAMQGHMYAIEAFGDILLAEMFCSGIPLPIIHLNRGYSLTRGFTTEEVYRHAIALLDSGRNISADSTRILHFIAVSKARAYLGLGIYDSAALAVSTVPDDFKYSATYSSTSKNFFFLSTSNVWTATVANQKGSNGIDYITSKDPRAASTNVTADIWFPKKYLSTGLSPIVIASGVEAHLIRAEAALQSDNASEWLRTMNALRTLGSYSVTPNPANQSVMDTTWAPGIGSANFAQPLTGLAPLSDPGFDTARVSLLFRERALWLYLTGHRQGDLRRLISQYRRSGDDVYPTGSWGPLRNFSYGTDVVLPVPIDEIDNNPLYQGCISNDA